jgi:hypothetical protein
MQTRRSPCALPIGGGWHRYGDTPSRRNVWLPCLRMDRPEGAGWIAGSLKCGWRGSARSPVIEPPPAPLDRRDLTQTRPVSPQGSEIVLGLSAAGRLSALEEIWKNKATAVLVPKTLSAVRLIRKSVKSGASGSYGTIICAYERRRRFRENACS